MNSPHYFSAEEIAFIRQNITGCSRKDLLEVFNARFGLTLTLSQIVACLKNRGINSGRNGRFIPGQVPHNKGVKGLRYSPSTEFKKGNRPMNYLPVDTERVTTKGYVEIKIADPNKWKSKAHIIWEAKNGPVSMGSALIYADGNKQNVTLDNLLLVSRGELAMMNRFGLRADNKELTTSGRSTAVLIMKIAERSRR